MSYWICDKDQNCIDCPKHYPEETCEHWIEVESVKDIHTNADNIRAITDEELAELIGDNIDCGSCKDMANSDVCPVSADNERDCHKYWLDWLKQEVKDG